MIKKITWGNILVIWAKKRSSKRDMQPRNHKEKKKGGRFDYTKIPKINIQNAFNKIKSICNIQRTPKTQ